MRSASIPTALTCSNVARSANGAAAPAITTSCTAAFRTSSGWDNEIKDGDPAEAASVEGGGANPLASQLPFSHCGAFLEDYDQRFPGVMARDRCEPV
jgi:hypothetical protein